MTPSQAKERATELLVNLGLDVGSNDDPKTFVQDMQLVVDLILSTDKSAKAEQREVDAKIARGFGHQPICEVIENGLSCQRCDQARNTADSILAIRSQHEQGER